MSPILDLLLLISIFTLGAPQLLLFRLPHGGIDIDINPHTALVYFQVAPITLACLVRPFSEIAISDLSAYLKKSTSCVRFSHCAEATSHPNN